MPISGLVLTLNTDRESRAAALGAITADPRVEIGEQSGHRLAMVVETDSSAEDRQFWLWINELPGVEFVEVAFVAFDEMSPGDGLATDAEVACPTPLTAE